MRLFHKILIVVGSVMLVILIGITLFFASTGPKISADANAEIKAVIRAPLPELIRGHTGFANNHGVKLWYESIEPESLPTGSVLLIMGIANDGLSWPESFIDFFVNKGYQVIRFDHRGTGMSDWIEDWDSAKPYSLADMSDDCIAILDKNNIEQAHIIGISMGGMIAQEMAIYYPGRILTLTSIMSSGNILDPDLPPISTKVTWKLVRNAIKYGLIPSEKNMVKMAVANRIILNGNSKNEVNTEETAYPVLYNLRMRKGYNYKVSMQHQSAVQVSGSRYGALAAIEIPTLIIHGRADPLIPIEHGQKCANTIPTAQYLWVEGMGHDIAPSYINVVCNRILKLVSATPMPDGTLQYMENTAMMVDRPSN